MQSNSKGHRHLRVRECHNAWLGDYPNSWRPTVLRMARRRLERADLQLEDQLENDTTDWWMFDDLDHDYGRSDYWYHCWLREEVQRLARQVPINPVLSI
jgi:hypothetical protein